MISKMSITSMLLGFFFQSRYKRVKILLGIELPVTQQDFRNVYRGLSKSDLIEKIGSPSSQNHHKHLNSQIFFSKYNSSFNGKKLFEDVTVIIFVRLQQCLFHNLERWNRGEVVSVILIHHIAGGSVAFLQEDIDFEVLLFTGLTQRRRYSCPMMGFVTLKNNNDFYAQFWIVK